MSRGTLDPALLLSISDTRLSRFLAGLPRPFSYQLQINYAVLTPKDKSSGLGSFPFARRYSGNRCFFLFLRVLRCFSSPGSLAMSCLSHSSVSCHYAGWVSPFRHLWINGYVLLPTAFRSLSRLSSAPSAKASTLCPFSLGLSARVLVRINLVKSLLIFDLAFWLSVEIVDYPSHHIAMLILIFSISSL